LAGLTVGVRKGERLDESIFLYREDAELASGWRSLGGNEQRVFNTWVVHPWPSDSGGIGKARREEEATRWFCRVSGRKVKITQFLATTGLERGKRLEKRMESVRGSMLKRGEDE
jgi:hypothetical protein